jgi:hypothetical protein
MRGSMISGKLIFIKGKARTNVAANKKCRKEPAKRTAFLH